MFRIIISFGGNKFKKNLRGNKSRADKITWKTKGNNKGERTQKDNSQIYQMCGCHDQNTMR